MSKLSAVTNIIKNFKLIARDPEQFLISKYHSYDTPRGFRIDLYTARKFKSICAKVKSYAPTPLKVISIENAKKSHKKYREKSLSGVQKKTFCPFCEKSVVPKRLHKLDFADIIIALFTAGLWAIFLFVMYLFIRRCPTCDYNLRGFRSLSEKKRR